MNNFAVFILTHGRANRVKTYHTLRRCGYTGKVYLIVDNEDKQIAQYRKLYGEQVIVFNKTDMIAPQMINTQEKRCILYARNQAFEIAKDLGLDYFMELDDDYSLFDYRFDNQKQYIQKRILSLDAVLEALLEYYKAVPALTIAMGQSGDYIGGRNSTISDAIKTKRKAMNSFICSTNRPFEFVGHINEDVNAYVLAALRGDLVLTDLQVSLTQTPTQENKGGMTELYQDNGTYMKSFFPVMLAPSCVKVAMMGYIDPRIHHAINWKHAAVKIIPETYKKVTQP